MLVMFITFITTASNNSTANVRISAEFQSSG